MKHNTQPIADFFAEQHNKLQALLDDLDPDYYDYDSECGFDDTFTNPYLF